MHHPVFGIDFLFYFIDIFIHHEIIEVEKYNQKSKQKKTLNTN